MRTEFAILSYAIGITWSLLIATPSFGTQVLAPGKSRTIAGEQVVCSAGQTSSFAKAYYSCTPGFSYTKLTITTNSETGYGQVTAVALQSSDDCNSIQAILAAKKSNITKYTEIATCGYTDVMGPVVIHLNTYALTITGGLALVNTDDSVTSEADCVAKANAFNNG
jgi:hypothetical protein